MKPQIFYLSLLALLLFACSKKAPDNNFHSTANEIETLTNSAADTTYSDSARLSFNAMAMYLLLKQDNDSLNNEQLMSVTRNYFHLKNWPLYKVCARHCLNRALLNKNKYLMVKGYQFVAESYNRIQLFDSTMFYLIKAEKLLYSPKDQILLSKIHLSQAGCQFYANDYLGADISLAKASQLAKNSDDKQLIFRIMSFTATIANEMKEYKKAIEKHKQTLNFLRKYNLDNGFNQQAVVLNNIGNTYLNMNLHNKAVPYFELALKNKKSLEKDQELLANLFDNLGYSNMKLNRYEQLPALFYSSLQIRKRMEMPSGIVLSNIHLSEYYFLKRDSLKALEFAKKAEYTARLSKTPSELLISLQQLTMVDSKNGPAYTNEYITVNDSLQQAERKSQNKLIHIQFETDEVISEKDQAIHQKWIMVAIATILFLFGLVLFFIIMQRVKSKELQFFKNQQKANQEIFELIQNQHSKLEQSKQHEKKRIAKDLHDGIMNHLASTRLNLHILNEKKDLATIEKCLPFIDNIHSIEKEIRNIAHDLNKDVFSSTDSFRTIIESLFNDQKNISKINTHLEIASDINWDNIETTNKINLYRILQEALQNINKHSQAQNMIVSILNKNKTILLEIYDDGIGFNLKQMKTGIGLNNMKSRVDDCRGTIDINSNKGEGTTITITIPQNS